MTIKTMKMAILAALTAVAASTATFAQETSYQARPNVGLAQIIGGLVGGKIANEITKDKKQGHQNIATILGALVGASVAGKAALPADQRDARFLEHDNEIMERTGMYALHSGQRQYWSNPVTGSEGVMVPSDMYYASFTGQQEVCRTLNTQSMRNNIPHHGQIVACKVNNTWVRRQ